MKNKKPYDWIRGVQIGKWVIRAITCLWIKKIRGIKNLPKDGPFILAPNHCSYIEHLFLGSIITTKLNRKLHFIAKKEHFESISQNTWHRAWGKYVTYIPIDRNKGEKAIDTALRDLKKGAIIVIYPEGTRSLNGKIQKGKTGIIRLALGSKVPVVPVGFKGTFEILPKGKNIPRLRRASINFGEPISFKKYQNEKITKKLLRTLTDSIMKQIAFLSGQKYNF
ncbi:1-acyl-sn-glycerol-3-phosphate acyltransferase [Candidatus Woesearchaeota archaeon]|nr:1-acyl-sn-glycerol-3-phosphate acyltransferase [Candidatus Woesearchaeota archaeon]